MNWTKENIELLGKMYDANKTDKEIALYFGTTELAVARKRSTAGFVKFTRNVETCISKPKQPAKEPFDYIIAYTDKQGADHFATVRGNIDAAKHKGRQLLVASGVKELTLYKPVKKLIVQNIVEQDL